MFLQRIHKLNSVLWLCKIVPVWDSATECWPCSITCSPWGWRPDEAKWMQTKACVTCRVKSCLTLQWYRNCRFRVPDSHSCESNQNKIGNKFQVDTLSDHPESLWWSNAAVMLSGGGSYYYSCPTVGIWVKNLWKCQIVPCFIFLLCDFESSACWTPQQFRRQTSTAQYMSCQGKCSHK